MPTMGLCVEMFNSLNLGGGLGVCMLVFMMGLCLEKFKMFKCSKFGVWVCVCVCADGGSVCLETPFSGEPSPPSP